jgi:hypothetical protein
MHLDELQERKYIQVFEDTCYFVARRKYTDPRFSIADLERLLDTAYTREGNDWVGRGAVADIVNAATIAAYEHMLIEWKKEQGILKEL